MWHEKKSHGKHRLYDKLITTGKKKPNSSTFTAKTGGEHGR